MKYHKINAPYKRWRKDLHDESMLPEGVKWNQFKTDEFSMQEFEYLFDNDWVWTEKLDGTNIRLYLERVNNIIELTIKGRTDEAIIPKDLNEWILTWFDTNHDAIDKAVSESMIIYGEGVGAKIQKGGLFGEQHFKMFDVLIGKTYLELHNVQQIAGAIGLDTVDCWYVGSMRDAIELVRKKPTSAFGDFIIEGLIGKPTINILDRQGQRIITKVKVKDFT